MDAKPGPYAFSRAILARWFTAMSGPLSVPTAIAALFVPNEIAKLLLGLTAIACLVFTGYWIWKTEREKVIELQERLSPKLQLTFDKSIPGCMEVGGMPPKRVLTVRLLPTTVSRVENCRGQLCRISESVDGEHWSLTNYVDALDLRWTHRKSDTEWTPMRIVKDVQQTLDVFAIGEKENVLYPSTLSYPRPLPDFTSGKWFKFDVKISGDGNAEDAISLKVKLGETWNNLIVEKA